MILPSRNEGLGCVLLEAQACGIPVIGSGNGGIPEAILDKDCIVEDDEQFEEKFAQKIGEILNSANDSAVLSEYIKRILIGIREESWNTPYIKRYLK